MKKVIITVSVMLIGFIGYGQKGIPGILDTAPFSYTDSARLQQSIDTSITVTKVYNDVKGALNGMAAGLKTTAGHVYQVLVYQQRINAIMWLILFMISSVFLLMGVISINTIYKNDDHFSSLKENIGIALFLVFGAIFVIALCHIDTVITGFLNPEYGAIKEITDMIK